MSEFIYEGVQCGHVCHPIFMQVKRSTLRYTQFYILLSKGVKDALFRFLAF